MAGITYSNSDLLYWRDRYANGYSRPTNMPDLRAATLARADSFVSDPSQDLIDWDPNVTPVDSYGEFVLSAAYEYLVARSLVYGTPVKNFILDQINEASVDYSTFSTLGTGSDNVSFSAAWVNKLFKAYDYARDLFSPSEKTNIQTWFANAGLFFQRSLNERIYLGNIPLRSERYRYDTTALLIAAQADHYQGVKCWVKETNLYYELTNNGTKTGSISDYTTATTAYRKYDVDATYVDRAAMQADQGNQTAGQIFYPQDISANFCYIYTGQTNGLLSDYVGAQRYLDQVAASGTLTGTYTHKTATGVDTNNIPSFSDTYKNPMSMMAFAIALIGHELNDGVMKDHAKMWVEEYLKFGTFPDGTVAEYRRNGDPRPQQGCHFYGTICLEACINIADTFYRNSDSSLYTFTTSEGLHGTEGGSKNIRLLIETQIENITGEVARFYDDHTVTANQLDSYYETTNNRYLPELIFGVANKYYDEARIKTTYLNTISGSRPYASSGDFYPTGSGGHSWGGTMGYWPDITMTYEVEELFTLSTINCKLSTGSDFYCSDPIQPGLHPFIYLINKDDILSYTILDGAVNNLTLKAGKTAYLFQGIRGSVDASFEKREIAYGSGYSHKVDFSIFAIASDAKTNIGKIAVNKLVAITFLINTPGNDNTYFEIHGLGAGLEASQISRINRDQESQSAFRLSLTTPDNLIENKLPLTYFNTDYSTSLSELESLLAIGTNSVFPFVFPFNLA
jgi:hypothetical protein